MQAGLVSRFEHAAKAEPAETIPLIGMHIVPMFLQPSAQVASLAYSDVVGTVIVVKDVKAALTPEIRGDYLLTRPSDAT